MRKEKKEPTQLGANRQRENQVNATGANMTKGGAMNATVKNTTSSSNPINKIGQAIVNGLKGLGNLITGSKK